MMSKINSCTNIYGVTMKCHYFMRHLLSYSRSTLTSTAKGSLKANPTTIYSNYLISLGFSRQQADPISLKLALSWQKNNNRNKKPSVSVAVSISSDFNTIWKRRGAETVSDFNFVANAHSVISYLRHIGSCDYVIRNIVSAAPKILVYNVNKTIKPKVKVLMNFGLSYDHIVHFLRNYPLILLKGLNSCIVPALRFWREFMGSSISIDDLIFYADSFFDNPRTLKRFVRNMNFLRDYGVPINNENEDWIRSQVVCPFFVYSNSFESVVLMVGEKLGIPPSSKSFLMTLEMISYRPISEEIIDSKRKLLMNFGWTETHVRDLLRARPMILYRSEDTIKEALGFLMNKVGYEPDYLASKPMLLCTDVKTNMAPRYEVFKILEEKCLLGSGQEFCIATLFDNKEFEKMFVKPFQDVLQVYGIDVNSFRE